MIDVVGKTDYSAPWRLESSTENLKHRKMNKLQIHVYDKNVQFCMKYIFFFIVNFSQSQEV